jgi:penicillin amidase
MIEADTDGITAEDIAAMHGDSFDQIAFEIVPYLEGLELDVAEEEEEDREESEKARKKREKKEREELEKMNAARDRLFTWNKRMEMDSAEAVLYSYFWIKLIEETFEDQYPQSQWPPKGQSRFKNAFYYLLEDPDNPWWDDVRTPEKRERRDEVLVQAFRKGYREAVDQLGDKLDSWTWGEVHTATFRNATFGESGIGPIEMIFNRGPVKTAGGTNKVNVTAWKIEKPFDVYHISSQRAIYDMSDLGASLMIHPTGQSGHPTHRHYDDYIEPWRKIEYHPSHWEREVAEKAARGKLQLRPKAPADAK